MACRHPRLKRPISVQQFTDEFHELWDRCRFRAMRHVLWPIVTFTKELEQTHNRNHRRYAQCIPALYTFEFAPQTLYLPKRYRTALIAHELGHCLAPDGDEDDADQAALQHLGIRITYDKRFPGKGLQTT